MELKSNGGVFFCALMALISSPAFGQDASVSVDASGFKLRVGGQGQWVCMADPSFGVPVVSRGLSQQEAKIIASQDCLANGGSQFWCDVRKIEDENCEFDKRSAKNFRVNIQINRQGANVNVSTGGVARWSCAQSQSFGGTYLVRAATQTEAKALARQACAYDPQARSIIDGKGSSQFCKDQGCSEIPVADSDSISIGQDGVNVDIGGAIEGIFNKNKKDGSNPNSGSNPLRGIGSIFGR